MSDPPAFEQLAGVSHVLVVVVVVVVVLSLRGRSMS